MDIALVAPILAILNIPLYLWLGKWIFGDWDGFWECIRFWLIPDLWSLFRGEWLEDQWAQMKLGFFVVLCAGAVGGELLLLAPLLTHK